MSVIDEVKQKTDIVEVISQYTTLKKAGRNLTALCPFHSEKRPSFFVYPEQQSWHCFGACSTGGDVFSFVMKKENIDFGEVLRLFAQRAGVTIPSRAEQDSRKDEKERLYQVNEAAVQYFHNLLLNSQAGEKARNYLDNRGLSQKTVSDFQLGFSLDSWEALKGYLMERGYTESELLEAGLIVATEAGKTHDRFRNRLMFPINDARGRTIGFGARVLDDSLPKYLNSPQTPIFDKSGSLYGINLATPAIRQQNLAVIVEGYIDVITAHQNGFDNVVAPMGTSVTHREEDKDPWRAYNEPAAREARRAGVERSEEVSEKQINILRRMTRNVVLALDADAAGEEAMLRCVDYENSLNAEVKVAILPEGKDPDDVIREDAKTWHQMVDEALPVVDYAIRMVSSKLDMSKARDQSILVDKIGPIANKMKDQIRQSHCIQELAKSTGKDVRIIEAALSQMKTASKTRQPKKEEVARTVQPLLSSPLEEYCLALLLQHLQLKNISESLKPEYFGNSENREIFVGWQQADDLPSLKDRLDPAIWEHLDILVNKNIPANQIEQKYVDCVLRLREKSLQDSEAKRAEILALEVELGGAGADLVKLEEEGIEPSIQLREIFIQKARRGRGKGDKK
ncbi:DNA primase [Chloroflexota bacterium]